MHNFCIMLWNSNISIVHLTYCMYCPFTHKVNQLPQPSCAIIVLTLSNFYACLSSISDYLVVYLVLPSSFKLLPIFLLYFTNSLFAFYYLLAKFFSHLSPALLHSSFKTLISLTSFHSWLVYLVLSCSFKFLLNFLFTIPFLRFIVY